jgi:magnesium transporter
MVNIIDKHPADVAEQLTNLDKRDRNLSFLMLSGDKKAEVFPYFENEIQQEIVKSLGDEELAEVLNKIDPDDRTKLFEKFPDQLIKNLISLLNDKEKQTALNLIGYEKDSIARLMTPHYIQVKKNWTVSQVLAHIKKYGKRAETLNYVYVIDQKNKLIDDLKIGQLLMADEEDTMEKLMDTDFVAIKTTLPMVEAFEIFEKYDRSALPIITENGILVGIVTIDDVIEKIKVKDTEAIQKFGGVDGTELSYTKTPILNLVRKRATWLIALFLGEMLTASAMGYFDGEIQKAIVLSLFVPLIISSGGNSGSQAASLIIRAMALKELRLKDWWYVMKKEIFSGSILGAILGAIGFLRIFIWQEMGLYDYGQYWPFIALSVSISLVFVVLWGTLTGSLIPFLLRRIGLDPATASAPFVATMVDVTGLILYFSISAMFLAGKLL